jgi:heat shock protein beta
MRKWTIPFVLLLLLSLFLLFADQGSFIYFVAHFKLRSLFNFVYDLKICSLGQKFQANAEGNSDELVDPPKVDDKIGAVLMEFQQIQMWLRGGYDLQFSILSFDLCFYVIMY